jgi:hypothetical protein
MLKIPPLFRKLVDKVRLLKEKFKTNRQKRKIEKDLEQGKIQKNVQNEIKILEEKELQKEIDLQNLQDDQNKTKI